MFWLQIAVTALFSAILTCILMGYWFKTRLWPQLWQQVDQEFRQRLEEASDVIGGRVETSVRKGVVDGVTSFATPQGISGTTRTIAKSSVDFVGDSLLGKARRRRRDDNRD